MSAGTVARGGLLDPVAAVAELQRWRGDAGTRKACEVFLRCDPRRESPGESWTHLRMLEAGYPEPQPQVVVRDTAGAFVARLDLGDADRRVAWEYDGVDFHSDPEQRAHDRLRRRQAEEQGWTVTPFGMEAVLGKDMALEASLAAVYGRAPAVTWRRW